jgi:hypothetical protein
MLDQRGTAFHSGEDYILGEQRQLARLHVPSSSSSFQIAADDGPYGGKRAACGRFSTTEHRVRSELALRSAEAFKKNS